MKTVDEINDMADAMLGGRPVFKPDMEGGEITLEDGTVLDKEWAVKKMVEADVDALEFMDLFVKRVKESSRAVIERIMGMQEDTGFCAAEDLPKFREVAVAMVEAVLEKAVTAESGQQTTAQALSQLSVLMELTFGAVHAVSDLQKAELVAARLKMDQEHANALAKLTGQMKIEHFEKSCPAFARSVAGNIVSVIRQIHEAARVDVAAEEVGEEAAEEVTEKEHADSTQESAPE